MPKKRKHQLEPEIKEYTNCTELDVISGRGNKISNWPGNVNFRQVCSRYRDEYHKATRFDKSGVADKILADIHKMGGRFIREVSPGGKWVVISKDRAAEKTCQALREKESKWEKTLETAAAEAAATAASQGSSTKKKKTTKKKLSPSDKSGGDPTKKKKRKSSGQSGVKDNNSAGAAYKKKKKGGDNGDAGAMKPAAAITKHSTTTLVERLRNSSVEDMIKKLEGFKSAYGHCGVPPGWPRDTLLADWCTAQRQRRREIECGYREYASGSKEFTTAMRLDEMGFVWDYAEWHWNDRCKKLEECQQQQKHPGAAAATTNSNDNEEEDSSSKQPITALSLYDPQDIVDWLQDQRCQFRTGTAGIPNERTEKLRRMGITL